MQTLTKKSKTLKETSLNMVDLKDNHDDISFDIPEDLREHLGSEVFLLSSEVIKYNKYGWKNIRTIVLT